MFQRVYCKLLCEMKDGNFGWSCWKVKAPWYNTVRNSTDKAVSGTNYSVGGVKSGYTLRSIIANLLEKIRTDLIHVTFARAGHGESCRNELQCKWFGLQCCARQLDIHSQATPLRDSCTRHEFMPTTSFGTRLHISYNKLATMCRPLQLAFGPPCHA